MAQADKKKKIFDGRYEIHSIVGRGACSVVYRAHHIDKPDIDIALKVLVDRKGLNKLRDRLRKEALAMVSSRHKYTLRLDDFHSIDSVSYLSMEYAPCSDLRIYTKKEYSGKLPPLQAERFLLQIAEALSFMHQSGIIHRDLKPDNILVMNDRLVKLGDFGVTMLPGEELHLNELRKGVGTLDYMAPEVVKGEGCNQQSDVFSLAVAFYELLSGVQPFIGAPLAKMLEARKEQKVTHLSALAPEVPGPLADIIMKAMSFEALERFKSAKEFLEALLNRKADGKDKKASSAPQEIKKPKPAPQRKPLVKKQKDTLPKPLPSEKTSNRLEVKDSDQDETEVRGLNVNKLRTAKKETTGDKKRDNKKAKIERIRDARNKSKQVLKLKTEETSSTEETKLEEEQPQKKKRKRRRRRRRRKTRENLTPSANMDTSADTPGTENKVGPPPEKEQADPLPVKKEQKQEVIRPEKSLEPKPLEEAVKEEPVSKSPEKVSPSTGPVSRMMPGRGRIQPAPPVQEPIPEPKKDALNPPIEEPVVEPKKDAFNAPIEEPVLQSKKNVVEEKKVEEPNSRKKDDNMKKKNKGAPLPEFEINSRNSKPAKEEIIVESPEPTGGYRPYQNGKTTLDPEALVSEVDVYSPRHKAQMSENVDADAEAPATSPFGVQNAILEPPEPVKMDPPIEPCGKRKKRKTIKESSQPNYFKVILIIVALLLTCDFMLKRTTDQGISDLARSALDTVMAGAGIASPLPRFSGGVVSFPDLPDGVYSGTLSGLFTDQPVPMTIISDFNQGKLFILLGLEGWSPAEVDFLSLVDENGVVPTEVKVRSNGIVLKLSGQYEDAEIVGLMINPITKEKGEWRVTPVQ